MEVVGWDRHDPHHWHWLVALITTVELLRLLWELHHVVVVALLNITRVAIHSILGLNEVEVVDLLDVLRVLGQLVLLDVELVLSKPAIALVLLLLTLPLVVVHGHGSLVDHGLLGPPALGGLGSAALALELLSRLL